MKISNHSKKDLKLVEVKGDFAGQFELHTMEMSGEKMIMRRVESISIKQHETTELKSGGLHIMVFNIKNPLVEGQSHKVNLIFDDKSVISTDVKITKE